MRKIISKRFFLRQLISLYWNTKYSIAWMSVFDQYRMYIILNFWKTFYFCPILQTITGCLLPKGGICFQYTYFESHNKTYYAFYKCVTQKILDAENRYVIIICASEPTFPSFGNLKHLTRWAENIMKTEKEWYL